VVRVLRSLRVMPLAAALLMSAGSAYGQDADADKATESLNTGMRQIRELDYSGAKATLLQVDRNRLSDAQRKQLDEKLRGLDSAIQKQHEAKEAYLAGEKALKARDLPEARRQFRVVAESPYVTPELRGAAQAELTRTEARLSVLAAAAEEKAGAPAQRTVVAKSDSLKLSAAPAREGTPSVTVTPPSAGVVVAQADVKPPPKAGAPATAKAAPPQPATPLTPAQEEFNRLMALGKAALAERKGGEAEVYFLKALRIDPASEQASLALDQGRALQEKATGEQAVGKLRIMQRVAWTSAVVEMEKVLARSSEATRAPEREVQFDNAHKDAMIALEILGQNRGYCDSADEYRGWEQRINDRIRDIKLRKAEWLEFQATLARNRSIDMEQQRVRRQEQARRDQIDDLTRRARTMLDDGAYEGAVQTLTEIQRLDPKNRWVGYQLEAAKREVEIRRQRQVSTDTSEQTALTFRDVRESEIPWYLEIVYPNDWREKSLRRKGFMSKAGAEDEKTRITRQKLQITPVRMEFEGQELGFIIDYLRETTDLPIHVKWRALEAAEIQPRTPITIKLKNVTAEKALKVLLDDLSGGERKLTYTIDEGVITISTGTDLKTRVVQRTYDVRDMLVTVPNFTGPRIDVSKLGQNRQNQTSSGLFEDRTGAGAGAGTGAATGEPGAGEEGTGRETKAQIIDKMMKTIRTVIDPASWKPADGAGTEEQVGTIQIMHGQLIITQTPGNQEKLVKLLADLREAQSLQVLVESRWLTVKNGWLERIGVDIDFTFGPDVHPFGRHITFTGNRVTQNSSGFIVGDATGAGALTSGTVGGIADTLGTYTGITMQGQFLDDIQVDFLIQATQATRDSRLLSAPRIMLMDGQRSYITIGRQQAYVSGYEPIVSENVAAIRPIVDWIPTGVVLDVEATVSADRRYVTMTVRPQSSELIALVTLPFGNLGAFIQLPDWQVNDLQSTVTVPDGGTVLLGGLKKAAEQDREIGVPILNKVPIINRLFTNRGMVRDAETLLILVSPKIIIHTEMEELRFPPPLPTATTAGM